MTAFELREPIKKRLGLIGLVLKEREKAMVEFRIVMKKKRRLKVYICVYVPCVFLKKGRKEIYIITLFTLLFINKRETERETEREWFIISI